MATGNLMSHLTRPLLQNMKYERLLMFVTMTTQQEMVLKLQGKEMATQTRMRGKILN